MTTYYLSIQIIQQIFGQSCNNNDWPQMSMWIRARTKEELAKRFLESTAGVKATLSTALLDWFRLDLSAHSATLACSIQLKIESDLQDSNGAFVAITAMDPMGTKIATSSAVDYWPGVCRDFAEAQVGIQSTTIPPAVWGNSVPQSWIPSSTNHQPSKNLQEIKDQRQDQDTKIHKYYFTYKCYNVKKTVHWRDPVSIFL